MKTVSYNDRYGYIVTEDYLQFLESYEAGNVPKQQIDVNGTLVDSDKLYEIIDKADTRATVRTAIKKQEIVDECERKAPWYFRLKARAAFYAITGVAIAYIFAIFGYIPAMLGCFIQVIYYYMAKSYGVTESYQDIIDNYEAERWKRFDRE